MKKRLFAFLIDHLIFLLVIMIVGPLIIFIDNDITAQNVSLILTIFLLLYNFIFDYFFKGITPGKKCMKIKMYFEDEHPNYFLIAIVHSLCRTFLDFVYFIGAFLFIVGNGKMPYERWLHISIKASDEKERSE